MYMTGAPPLPVATCPTEHQPVWQFVAAAVGLLVAVFLVVIIAFFTYKARRMQRREQQPFLYPKRPPDSNADIGTVISFISPHLISSQLRVL